MGGSLLTEKQSERRQNENEVDIQQLQTAAFALWCLDGSWRKADRY